MKIKEIIKQPLLVLVATFRVLYEAVSGPEPDYFVWIMTLLGLSGTLALCVILIEAIIRAPLILVALVVIIGVLFALPYVLCKLINKIKKIKDRKDDSK